jgi:hypothetical protein
MSTSELETLKPGTVEPGTEGTNIEAVVCSLRRLLEGDQREQSETFEFLKHALEEDRPSNRRLFK